MECHRPYNQLYNELNDLIYGECKKELKCREYLQYVDILLFRGYSVKKIYNGTEFRGNYGDSDYLISAKYRDEGGVDCVRAYVWELKAPQCFIFDQVTNNRLQPSKDLIQAENQLLNYYCELRGSNLFLKRYKVTEDQVCFGGIIIGSDKKKVNPLKDISDEEEIERLYSEAYSIRKTHFYKPNEIRLISWDTILNQFKTESHVNEEIDGKQSKPIVTFVK